MSLIEYDDPDIEEVDYPEGLDYYPEDEPEPTSYLDVYPEEREIWRERLAEQKAFDRWDD